MVKGISRQVIVVQAPEPRLFEQAIFILRDDMGEGITEDALLKEAQKAVQLPEKGGKHRRVWLYGAFWAALGAAATGTAWVLTALI